MRKLLRSSQRAVSDIIANILILAITVVLFSGVILWVWAIPTPQKSFVADIQGRAEPIGVFAGNYVYRANLTHRGGEALKDWATKIIFIINSDTPTEMRFGKVLHDSKADTGVDVGKEWTVGETCSFKLYLPVQPQYKPDVIRIRAMVYETNVMVLVMSADLNVQTGNFPPIILDTATIPSPVRLGLPFRVSARVIDLDSDLDMNKVFVDLAPLGLGLLKMSNVPATDTFQTATIAALTDPKLIKRHACKINATDLAGNEASAIVWVDVKMGCDLEVQAAEISIRTGPNPKAGDWASVTFTVRNVGALNATADVFAYDLPANDLPRFIGWNHTTLLVGMTKTWTYTWNISGPGFTHRVKVEVRNTDPPEFDYTNNVAYKPFTVTMSSGFGNWLQTTETDFNGGTTFQTVVTSFGGGAVELASYQQQYQLAQDATTVSRTNGGWAREKYLTFHNPGWIIEVRIHYDIQFGPNNFYHGPGVYVRAGQNVPPNRQNGYPTTWTQFPTRSNPGVYDEYYTLPNQNPAWYTVELWVYVGCYGSSCGTEGPLINTDLSVYASRTQTFYYSSGTYTSREYDAGMSVTFARISWNGNFPATTGVSFETRTRPSGGSWSPWTPTSPPSSSPATIQSPAGRYFQFRFTLTTGNQQVTPRIEDVLVSWLSISNYAEGGLNAQYYDNMDFTNLKVLRTDPYIGAAQPPNTFSTLWGAGSPDAALGSDTFSARWSGLLRVDKNDSYVFYVKVAEQDEGLRLYIDGAICINVWNPHPQLEYSVKVDWLLRGFHDIKIEYYENLGNAGIELFWSSSSFGKTAISTYNLYYYTGNPLPSGGLKGYYWNNKNLAGSPVTPPSPRIENVNFNWDTGSPHPNINPDSFSARWEGWIEIEHPGLYKFLTYTSDGVRLWLDINQNDQFDAGEQYINQWNVYGTPTLFETVDPATNVPIEFNLKAGLYKVRMEYFEDTGIAVAQLLWSSFMTGTEPIPPERLFYMP